MSYESQLDAKIHKFLARKEREHPELHESVDQLFYELTSPHFNNNLQSDRLDIKETKGSKRLDGRMGGLRYAS